MLNTIYGQFTPQNSNAPNNVHTISTKLLFLLHIAKIGGNFAVNVFTFKYPPQLMACNVKAFRKYRKICIFAI